MSPVVGYTAFGEPVTWDAGTETWRVGFPAELGTRYQYDGGWGYECRPWGPGPGAGESGSGFRDAGSQCGQLTLWGENVDLPPVMLVHVGWRWYQPGTGRFVQRDPIGLDGGVNLYGYCSNDPLLFTDPSGEGFWDGNNWFHDWVARNFWLRYHSVQHINSPWATAEAIGLSVVGGAAAYCVPHIAGALAPAAVPSIVQIGDKLYRDGRFVGWVLNTFEHGGQVMYRVLTKAGEHIYIWGQR